jgi:signal transduction histidine kinase
LLGKLRHRLILSHLVPYLVIIPIVGMTLVYLVESQVILARVASELTGQGVLVAELSKSRPEVWEDPAVARAFGNELLDKVNSRMMLIDSHGVLLWSSDPSDDEWLGQAVDLDGIDSLSPGDIRVNTLFSTQMNSDVVDVLIPVAGSEQELVGVIRLSHQLADVYEHLLPFRAIITGVLAVGLLLTAVLGMVLSLNIERPIKMTTAAIQNLIHGENDGLLVEQGPDEIRFLQRSFNELLTRLHDLDEIRRRLISNLVHELGRSLGSLRAAIQALLRGGTQDRQLEHDLIAGMDEETKQLRRLLDDLSELQDALSGSLDLIIAPLDLNQWLRVVLRPWETMASGKGLAWKESIPPGLPQVLVDSDRLDQALGNLLSNAIKFTPKGGSIAISALASEAFITIDIQDTGPGIPLEEHDRIFMPFYQSRSGGGPAKTGMGLGLSIARELVVRQNGEILVESTPGVGSQFSIRLPIEKELDPFNQS